MNDLLVRSLTIALVTLLWGCHVDDTSVGSGASGDPGAGGQEMQCMDGGCAQSCDGVCTAFCSGGNCEQTCREGTSCTFHCGGGFCTQICEAGSECSLNCSGGFCSQQCQSGSDCNPTCTGGGCG